MNFSNPGFRQVLPNISALSNLKCSEGDKRADYTPDQRSDWNAGLPVAAERKTIAPPVPVVQL